MNRPTMSRPDRWRNMKKGNLLDFKGARAQYIDGKEPLNGVIQTVTVSPDTAPCGMTIDVLQVEQELIGSKGDNSDLGIL